MKYTLPFLLALEQPVCLFTSCPITAKRKYVFHTKSMLPVTSQGVIMPGEHYEIHTSVLAVYI